MFRLLMKFYWKLSGWKTVGQFPYHYKKIVLAVAPHTSWKDIPIGLAARCELRIEHAKFLGKKELFDGAFGFVFRWLGGIPVDRFCKKGINKHGIVEQAVTLFSNNEAFILGIAPEGTRKRVNKLRSGFYQIAKKAQVPIIPFGLDFEHKQILIGEPLFTSPDEEEDLKKMIAFFSTIKGKEPTLDLRHLKVAERD
jgi:1-acyl-sn-glycerol-3-phosphate acyltransferase